jgi:hypothetical protein
MTQQSDKPLEPQPPRQGEEPAAASAEIQPELTEEKQAGGGGLADQLKEEMAKWQTKIDEAKLQLHLGAREAQDKIEPHVEKLERELNRAKDKWQQIEGDTERAWQDIDQGLKASFSVMEEAFDKAQRHFKKEAKK